MTDVTVPDVGAPSGTALLDAYSSVPHGNAASSQIEMAETELRRLGLGNVKVQHFGELARVIVDASDISTIAVEPLRGEVVNLVKSAGFTIVALDLTGSACSPD